MRRFILCSTFVAICLAAWAPAQANETYLRLPVKSRQEVARLNRLASVDAVRDSIAYVYASDRQLAALRDAGLAFTVLLHPGDLITPRMSATARDAMAWDTYPTYGAYVDMMNQFALAYPGLCTIEDIGPTINGHRLLFARISGNVGVEENEPEVMYTSSMHGDELTGYVLMLRLIDSLLSSYGTDSVVTHMVDNMEIWINPLANPDGTFPSSDNTVFGARRYNANWIDINRNFPDPEDGLHPDGNAWQPETVAMMDLASANNFVLSANFHGGAEVINYPWDTWIRRHADDAWFENLSRDYATLCQFNSPPGYMTDLNNGITNGYDWYTISGGRQDCMTYWYHCREVTIEISATKLIPESQLLAHWDYNRDALLDYLQKALYGIKGLVTDASTGNPLPARVRVLGLDTDSSSVTTDLPIGDYHRMIAPGMYTMQFSSQGYIPDTAFGVVAVDQTVTTLNVTLAATPTCACPHQADANADGFVDSIDLSEVIDAVFFGGNDPQDPLCPSTRFDLNCDTFTTSEDLALIIDYVFFAGAGPCDPCAP